MEQNSTKKREVVATAEIIETHYCLLESAVPTGIKDEFEWLWRKYYVGMYGILTIYKCTNYPDKHFCMIRAWNGDYLRTGRGDLTHEGNKIIIRTKNSIYTFVIITDRRQKRRV